MRSITRSFLLSSLLLIGFQSTFAVGETRESLFLQIQNKFARVQATLHKPRQSAKVAIVHAHPWSNVLGSFPAAMVAERGIAVLSFNTRGVNRDSGQTDVIFERLLLDVAATVQEMKGRGYQRVILMGGSAGGPLMSAYQNVAENGNAAFDGDRKLYKFPGFFEEDGSSMSLPKADGLIFRNPIAGTSTSFLNRLDPSIVDEATGKRNPSLDMFDASNGFAAETGLASYHNEFGQKYGRGQASRMNRLIDSAQKRLAAIKEGEGPYTDDDLMIIMGTRARLMYTDMSLGHGTMPNLILPDNEIGVPKHDRAPGHYSLTDNVKDRNASVRGAVVHTLQSFLSFRAVRAEFINPSATNLKAWGIDVESTNNATVGNMMHVNAPWLLFTGTADDKINTAELIYNQALAKDKKIIVLHGATHGITSVDPKRFEDTATLRGIMADQIAKWINERFQ